jgi:hypothetical protein
MIKQFRGTEGFAVVLAFILLALAVPAYAQSPTLGDVARQEQERRKAASPTGKVYRNEDLKDGGLPSAPPPADPASPGAGTSPGDAAKSSTDAQNPAAKVASTDKAADKAPKGEAEWRTLITGAREELQRNETFLEALQSRINALTTDFAARDNPVERAQIAEDRQKALEDLARVKADVDKGKKHITEIEEEARKAGVPAGWLR